MATGEDLTLNQVAQELDRSLEQVRRYVRGGKLPARKLGMQWFVSRKDLDTFRGAGGEPSPQELMERLRANREQIRERHGRIDILELLGQVRGSRD
jgi:hypothetical protein